MAQVISGSTRIETVQGDLTGQVVDAIVNAANSSLLGGGGVDGAIHRAAGPELLAECRTLGGCPTGEARITRGYRLPARHVIHTVGPVYRDGRHGEPEQLASCYRESLRLARENGVRTIAFPAISCGVYGYPHREAAEIAVGAVLDVAAAHPDVYELIRFVLWGEAMFGIFTDALVEAGRKRGLETHV